MRGTNEQKKRTRRAGVCAFVLTITVCAFAGGLYIVDMETGRTLHGADYHPAVDVTAVSAWLPPRLRVLWDVVGGKAYDCFFAFLDAER